MPERLSTYLNDHLAGASAGLELARRIAAREAGNGYGAEIGEIADEIAEDRAALEDVMDRLGVGRDHLRLIAAWGAERVRRTIPWSWVLDREGLGRLEELELLTAGVGGKRSLWQALDETQPVDGVDFAALAGRASSQLERLEGLRRQAAAEAFGRGPTG
jgi:hypothetical protein